MNLLASITERSYQRWSRWILIALTLVLVACVSWTIKSGIRLDTNLRSLSPAFSADAEVNQALNGLSANASQNIVLVIANKDQDLVDDASDLLQKLIDSAQKNPANLIVYSDQSQLMGDYARLLAQHPFHFLGKKSRQLAAEKNAEQANRLALSNLYGSGGQLKLIPVEQDPLGFVNEYALDVLDKIATNIDTESREVDYQGNPLFISPHFLRLNADSLSLSTQKKAQQQIQQIENKIRKEFPAVEFFQSGVIFFAADAAASSQADINKISIGSMLGIVILLFWVFRSLKALILPVVSIVAGVSFAFFFCHSLFGSIHILTIVFGASLIGVVVDYSLHYFYFCVHQQDASNINQDKSPLYRALLLSLLTSVIGYAALSVSGLTALKQVAIFSATGLIYAWLVVMALGPWLVKRVVVYDAGLKKIVTFVLTLMKFGDSSFKLLIGVLLILAVFAFQYSAIQYSDSPRALINQNQALVDQEQLVNSWVASYEPASFVLVKGKQPQEIFDRIALLETLLNHQQGIFPESTALLGVNDLFLSPKDQETNYQLNQWLYQPKDSISVAAKFIQENKLPANNLQQAYQDQKNNLLLPNQFFTADLKTLPPLWIESSQGIVSFMLIPKQTHIDKLKRELDGIEGVSYFSAVDDTRQGLQHLRQAAMKLLLLALVSIGFILAYHYNILKSLHLMAIPLMALSATLVILHLLNVPLSLFHIMALFLVLGLGMDYVVFVAEMTSAQVVSAQAKSTSSAAEFFPAIVLSAVTSLLSFGLLSLSSMPAVNAFGLTLLIGNSINLVGAFWLAAIWQKSFFKTI